MTRLLDLGIERTNKIVNEMAMISVRCVSTALESYQQGVTKKGEMSEWAEKLRILQDEVSDLAFELIARYQPVATDLRYIRSCLEVSYVLSRFGGYGYEIVEILDMMGSLSDCDKTAVSKAAELTNEMITLSRSALLDARDKSISDKLYEMDDSIDTIYRDYLKEIITAKKETANIYSDPRCVIATLLVLRYLERIADHTCYIGDSTSYIRTGKLSTLRRHVNP